jgi:hypothetical protein
MLMMERRAIEAVDNLSGFIFIDEDFFIHEKRAREFLDCVREGGVSPSIMGFGSVRGLSKFTANEIAEMGFDIIWTAFEGSHSGYKKLRGAKLDHLYQDLKSRGVAILTSMIIGFPYQDQPTKASSQGISPLILFLMRHLKGQGNDDINS